MEKSLFSITCTTCRARLAVHTTDVIGAILECPKCQSMVMVEPPEGWGPEAPQAAEPAKEPPKAPSDPKHARPKSDSAKEKGKTKGKLEAVRRRAADPSTLLRNSSAVVAAYYPVAVPAPPPAPPAPPSGIAPSPTAVADSEPVDTVESPPVATSSRWSLLMGSYWGQVAVLAASPLLGLAIVVVGWALLPHRSEPPAASQGDEATEPTTPESTSPSEPKPRPKPISARFDRRWLPDATRLVVSIRGSHLAAQAPMNKLLAQVDSWWGPSAGAVLGALGLRLDQVQRLTYASADLAAWPRQSVVVLELEEGQDAGKLLPNGVAVDLGTREFAFRRVSGDTWPHPFAAIDPRTIVTGQEDLLRVLIARSEVHLASVPLERLLKVVSTQGDATLLIDLSAARAARWKLPAALLDVWPAGRLPWHVLWETPEGLGCTVQWSESSRGELALVCEGETVAEKVRAAMDELTTAVKGALPGQVESLKGSLQAGRLTVAVADQYKFLLDEGLAALQAARWDTTDAIVWVRANWIQNPVAVAAAAVDSAAAMRADWRSAARTVDEANDRRLLTGLAGYVKAEGRFPAGAAGGALMPPETRLSWLAAMLPYYGHVDWHRRLEFGYPWNGPQNQPITRQTLPEVVNPALGSGATTAGFPVTHYVGVAGVGPDAGRLGADDPRAGVFGYARKTRMEDITDGASNTIAVLGVSDRCGPWASGGDATVRSLTKGPYVNGPDGFGSGQPDGMLAGMADGSVRFLSKDTDPRVMEQMATIRGSENVDLAALERKPPGPAKPQPEEVKPKAEAVKPKAEATEPKAAVKKPGPVQPAIDVQTRLADPIPEIQLPDIPLIQAVELLMAMSTVPISFDPDAMQELGATLHDPVTVKLSQTTVGKALEAIVSSRKLAHVIDNGQVLVTSPAEHRESLRTVRYTVGDLTDKNALATKQLADLVQKLVAPDRWQRNGGRGTIEPDGDALVVTQTGSVHYQLLAFCEKLRTVRGKPTRSRMSPELFTPATRADRAKAMLDHVVSANFGEPTPLQEILTHLKRSTGAEILIDRPALNVASATDNVKATLKLDKQPLSAAMGLLLDPLALGWRAVGADALQVTTRKAVAARLELEFYQVGSLLAKEKSAALIERIKGRLPGTSWSEGGGPGVILFDEPSQCLLVLQSQPVQIALEAILAEKAN